MKRFLCWLAILALLMLPAASAAVKIPQPTEDFWVLDEANVLSEATEGEIFFANQRLNDACGAEIVVVAVKSFGGMSAMDYAYSLYNNWKIVPRGLLLVLSTGDEDYYAMAGVSMDSTFDSATLGEMLDSDLEPDFAVGKYDAGVKRFFESAFAFMADQLNVDVSVQDGISDYRAYQGSRSANRNMTAAAEPRADDGMSFGLILVILILLVILIWSMRRFQRRGGRWANAYTAPPGGFAGGFFRPRRRWYYGGPFGVPHGHRPPPPKPPHDGNFGSSGFGGASRHTGSFGGPTTRGGGAGRSGGFGGFGETSGSRGFGSGGFGGASRHTGSFGGPSTRGGGAGRGGRR